MARIIVPEVVNLTGTLEIVQGSDNYFELQLKDADRVIVDLTGVDPATDIYCQFSTGYLNDAGNTTTGCPVPRVYISDAEAGKLYLHLPSVQTKWTSTQVLTGKWDMEIIIDGYKYRAFMGTWTIDGKQVTIRYSV